MILTYAVYLLDLRCKMVAPIPKTKAEDILNQLVSINESSTFLSPFQTHRFLKEIDVSMKSGVDIAQLWVCKGLVYSIAKQPRKMVEAFTNATRLGATDLVAKYNQGTKYMMYGYYNEAIEAFSKCLDQASHDHMLRIAIASLNFEDIKSLMVLPKFIESIDTRLEGAKKLGIDINQAHKVMCVFFDIIKKYEFTVALIEHNLTDDDYQLVFHTYEDIEKTTQILKEFDNLTASPDLFEASTKLNVILLCDDPETQDVVAA